MATRNDGEHKWSLPGSAWAFAGLVAGIVGTAALATPRGIEQGSKPGGASSAGPGPVDAKLGVSASGEPVSESGATESAEAFGGNSLKPAISPSPPAPIVASPKLPLKPGLTDSGPMPADPFGGSKLVLPKAPPATISGGASFSLPVSGLQGVIAPTAKNPAPLPAVKPTRMGDSTLKQLVAHGLPAAPAPLEVSTATPASPVDAPKAKLVTLELATKDPDAARQAIVDATQKLGGKSRVLYGADAGGKPVAEGVLIFVAVGSVEEFLKGLAPVGTILDRQQLAGTVEQRAAKLREPAVARLASLRALRAALLGSYKADAGPVKDVDTDVAAAESELNQLQTDGVPEETTVVRISFTASPS